MSKYRNFYDIHQNFYLKRLYKKKLLYYCQLFFLFFIFTTKITTYDELRVRFSAISTFSNLKFDLQSNKI